MACAHVGRCRGGVSLRSGDVAGKRRRWIYELAVLDLRVVVPSPSGMQAVGVQVRSVAPGFARQATDGCQARANFPIFECCRRFRRCLSRGFGHRDEYNAPNMDHLWECLYDTAPLHLTIAVANVPRV